MKKKILATFVISMFSSGYAFSDNISGGARADFTRNEMIIPCVKVISTESDIDNQYFDIVMQQRGNSLNYEVVFAEKEEADTCMAAEEAMINNDSDTSDVNGTEVTEEDESENYDPEDNDSEDDDSEDNDSEDDDSEDNDSEDDDSEDDDSEDNDSEDDDSEDDDSEDDDSEDDDSEDDDSEDDDSEDNDSEDDDSEDKESGNSKDNRQDTVNRNPKSNK